MSPTLRMEELLSKAAKAFEALSSPFATEWLSENKVSLDECGDLSETIAMAIKVYLALPKDERLARVLKETIKEADLPEQVKMATIAHIDLDMITKRLKGTSSEGSPK